MTENASLNSAENMPLRRVVLIAALLNLGFFFIEFAIARQIGSVSLYADSIDFIEDTSINFLILIALGMSFRARARLGQLMALILLVPAVALLWTAWQKFHVPTAPDPSMLCITGVAAMLVNGFCAYLLSKYRHHEGSLTKAAFLSARNDAFANLLIILAGLATLFWFSGWPDLIAGLIILMMNLDAAQEIWQAARKEHLSLDDLDDD